MAAPHQSGGEQDADRRAGARSTGEATPTIEGIALGPFETNCYVVSIPGSGDCWIVDAGFEPDELIKHVQDSKLTPRALILTHAHCDHIAGVFEVVRAFPGLAVMIHEAERAWLGDPVLNLSAMMGLPVTGPEPTRLLRHGDTLELAGTRWAVLHTPGHSPGGITLHHAESATALVGDTLFNGSVGRTDFPGSDPATLARSIRQHLYTMTGRTRVFPGHGPPTTIEREARSNPFVRA